MRRELPPNSNMPDDQGRFIQLDVHCLCILEKLPDTNRSNLERQEITGRKGCFYLGNCAKEVIMKLSFRPKIITSSGNA